MTLIQREYPLNWSVLGKALGFRTTSSYEGGQSIRKDILASLAFEALATVFTRDLTALWVLHVLELAVVRMLARELTVLQVFICDKVFQKNNVCS